MENNIKKYVQQLLDAKNFAPYADANVIKNTKMGICIILVNLTKFKDLGEI
jgi:hypothetical protein